MAPSRSSSTPAAPTNRDQYLDDVFSLVEPEDIRWVFVSHDDVDHTGNLNALMEPRPERDARRQLVHVGADGRDARGAAAPRRAGSATASRSSPATASCYAVRPPVFDSPTTRGLFDSKTGVYWGSDSFATPMLVPITDVDKLDAGFWHDGMAMFHQYVSPWYAMLDDAKYQRSVDRVASLGITAIAGCHTPAIGSAHVDRAIEQIRTFASVTVPAEPGQDVLDQMLAGPAAA